MSQNLSFESNSSPKALNPVLQAALSSLDVQLEEELARYRRQKSGRPVMSSKGLGRHQARKSLDLIDVERVETQPQRPALGMSTSPLASFPLFMVQPQDGAPTNATQQPASLDQVQVAPDSPNMVVAAPNPTDDQSATPAQTQPTAPPERPTAADLATLSTQSPPEDYLESSEQLLRSLAQEETTQTTPPPKQSFGAKLLTPLGVGSILLLLLGGATAAVVLSNPSLLDRFFGPKTPTQPQSSTDSTSTLGNAANKDTPVVNGPDLAADEFVDLNLNTLSQLQATPKASPSVPSVQVPALPTLPNNAVPPVAPRVVPNTALPRRAADLSSVLLNQPPAGNAPYMSVPQAGNAPYTPIPQVAPLPRVASPVPQSNTTKSNQSSAASNKSNTAKSNQPSAASTKSNTAKSNQPSAASTKSNTAKTSAKTPVTQQQPPSASPETVAASPVGTPGGFYYVFLQGEQTLEQARTIVADAYVEKFPTGEHIQMGAFPTESEAKAMVEELQRQGLAASIYHP
ncbi:MAG: hypothetical protein WA828_04525 [Coleofasciculaceae cyanobacterium]